MRWLRPSTDSRAEAGSASIEFVAAGLLLLLPIVVLVVVLARIEAAAFAAEGAARQVARIAATADSLDAASADLAVAIDLALADHGLEGVVVDYTITCFPRAIDCSTRGTVVTASVNLGIDLPLIPAGLGVELPSRLTISAVATEQRPRFGL